MTDVLNHLLGAQSTEHLTSWLALYGVQIIVAVGVFIFAGIALIRKGK